MDVETLQSVLPSHVELLIGDVRENMDALLARLSETSPIGFVSFDLDYYSSTKSAFDLLLAQPNLFLPLAYLYFDDITLPNHNSYCGELLAIREFNEEQSLRKIEYHKFLENSRIFRKAKWIKQIYFLHVLDHPTRNDFSVRETKQYIANPYLEPGKNEKFL